MRGSTTSPPVGTVSTTSTFLSPLPSMGNPIPPSPRAPGNHSNHRKVPPADLLEFYTFFAEVLMTLKKQ